MSWERFERGPLRGGRYPGASASTLTLRKDRRIYISGPAFALLGDTDNVELYFETTRRAIGVLKASQQSPITFKASKTYRGGGFFINCTMFFDQYSVPSDSRKISAHMEGEMLVAEIE